MKTASAALKAFIPSTRQFFEADLYTITPGGVPPPLGAPVFIQSSGVVGTSRAYGSNNTAGNMLTAFVCGGATPTDTAGNTWVSILSFSGGGQTINVYWVSSCKGGANTVSSAGATNIMIAEYSGVNTLGLSATNTGTGTAILSGSISPTQNNLLIVAGARVNAATTFSAFAPFNGRATDGFITSQIYDQVNVAPGTYQLSDTSSVSAAWGAFIISFFQPATSLLYTSCDRDILWNGKTYASGGPLITRGAMKQSLGLTVDTLDLSIDVTPSNLYLGLPLLQQLSAGLLDGARFQLDRLFGTSFGNWVDSVTLFTGNIADIKELGRTRCNLQVRSRLELLNNSLPRMLFQPSCRWSLFDSGCNLLKSNFTTNYTVAAGSTALTIKSNAAQANGYYDLGTITYLTGLNAGVSATVKAYLLSSGTFTLNAPLPFTVNTADTFAASAGCDKSQATCSGKFSNLINFGGMPFIPVPESAF